jgi:nitroreductase
MEILLRNIFYRRVAMEVKEALLKRRSCRKFSDQKVEDEKIHELLLAAMSGPSACNKKPWVFYVIKNEEVLNKLRNNAV